MDDDLALAPHIRQIPGIAGKQQIWQDKNGANERYVIIAIADTDRHTNGEEGQNHLVDIIVESAQKLGNEETE
jgi:hypothetical protein